MRQVTRELRTHSIWSWGWATFSEEGIDKDKGEAVCVYLWVRDQQLCSGPGAAGPAMDASLTVGQLDQLRPGVICQLPAGRDPHQHRHAARACDRGQRHRGERRPRAARAPAGGRAGCARRPRCRARLRRRPLPRQRVRVPRRAEGDSADEELRREGCSSTSSGATPSARASTHRPRAARRSQSSTARMAACRRAWSRPRGRSRGSAGRPAGSRSRRSLRSGSSRCREPAGCGRSTG